MRPFYWILAAIILLACSLQTVATQPPPPVAPAPTNTLVAVPVEPTQAIPTATLVPVALAGPPMEVGSMWPYIDGSILVAVPGGPFIMGHGGSDNPEHTVTLSDFWIYRGKVTNQQYALCVKAGDCKTPDPIDDYTFNDVTHADDPVVGINYKQAADYCTFVHGRLPTEAEWEKTARGPDGLLYPWGSNAPACNVLNYNNCVGKITKTTAYPDGQSYYRALDLEGNVYEWVYDWYDALYYKIGDSQDPQGPDSGQLRSVRSASYKSKPDEIPASTRRSLGPNTHRRDLGFRCVVDDPGYFAPLCTTLGSSNKVSSPDCPKVGIGLTESCQQGKVTVVVVDDHSPDSNASVTGVGACNPVSVTPGTFPQIYDCTSDTTVGVSTTCNFSSSEPATCASHYQLNPQTGQCEWDGSLTTGQACLPGLTYDPVRQCCSSGETKTDYPICGLGSALGYSDGKPICVPDDQALNPPSASELVHVQDPKTCTGTGKVPGSTCTQTGGSCKNSCRYGGVWVQSLCSCVCYPG